MDVSFLFDTPYLPCIVCMIAKLMIYLQGSPVFLVDTKYNMGHEVGNGEGCILRNARLLVGIQEVQLSAFDASSNERINIDDLS